MSASDRAAAVRQALREQAAYCTKLGSPFTAALCEALGTALSPDDDVGRRVLDWPGDPAPTADNLPLRLAGALHSLARSGRTPGLAAVYPPHATPSAAILASALRQAFLGHAPEIEAFLPFAPQTNEVGRSGVLIGGLLTIAQRFALPLALYEIGASAGLNLIADHYRYRLGGAEWGPREARLALEPQWTGSPPPVDAPLAVRERHGCDVNPIDVTDAVQRARLESYVWPDQTERVERLHAAIETALATSFSLDRADAADWIERQLDASAPQRGVTRVLFHSIVWNYLSDATRARIDTHLARLAAAARADAPFAWLRFELEPQGGAVELRLTLWPGGVEELLAAAHPHGTWVRWAAA